MDIKMMVIQRGFDIFGNIIADQLSKPDWESRSENISHLYKDLQSIKDNCPDAPDIREPYEHREKEKVKLDEIVSQICTPDLSPKEMLMCQECVRDVLTGSGTDVMQKYFVTSL